MITKKTINSLLVKGYPKLSKNERKQIEKGQIPARLGTLINNFPFSYLLKKIWITDYRYLTHGPKVLDAMNILLSDKPGDILDAQYAIQKVRLRMVIEKIRSLFNSSEDADFLLRLAAFYHDIGKCIIKERHPIIGWYMVQYSDKTQRQKLRKLLNNEGDYRLLITILRDHDHFGVLNTGEASFPILLDAINSFESLIGQKKIISALMLCNLADIVGSVEIDGVIVDRIIDDWQWVMKAIDYCNNYKYKIDEYLLQKASRISSVVMEDWETELKNDLGLHTVPSISERISRLLMEASRKYPDLRHDFDNEQAITDQLLAVFGTQAAFKEFAFQFTHICKFDYAKRFFEAFIKYSAENRISKEKIMYAIFGVLKRITSAYSVMIKSRSGLGNLIGVELKDLTPENAPDKTEHIIDLIFSDHYPGLTWMMSDVTAWYF